jgi:hypothetical protein
VSRLLARLRGPVVSGLEPHRVTFDAGQVAVCGTHRVLRADSVARRRQRADFNGDEPIYLARDKVAVRAGHLLAPQEVNDHANNRMTMRTLNARYSAFSELSM